MPPRRHFGQKGVCWWGRASLRARAGSRGAGTQRSSTSNPGSPPHDALSGRKENKTGKGGWERGCAGGRGRAAPLPTRPAPRGDGVGWGEAGGGRFAGWVLKGRLAGEGRPPSPATGANVTQRHLLSATTASATSSSQSKSGAGSARDAAAEGGEGEEAVRRRRMRSFLPCSPPEPSPRVPPPRGREHGAPREAILSLIEYSIFKITLRN